MMVEVYLYGGILVEKETVFLEPEGGGPAVGCSAMSLSWSGLPVSRDDERCFSSHALCLLLPRKEAIGFPTVLLRGLSGR